MAAQMKLSQTDQEPSGADDQRDAAEDAPSEKRTPTSELILTVQRASDEELTAEAQKGRLAKAEALYGAIAEINESTDDPDTKVNRRA